MKPNHSNSDIYGDIDSWSLKEAPERLKVNSDNLKEQIMAIVEDTPYLDFGEPDTETQINQLLQLFQDYAMGLVPPYNEDDPYDGTMESLHREGYNQCRQDILDNLEGKS